LSVRHLLELREYSEDAQVASEAEIAALLPLTPNGVRSAITAVSQSWGFPNRKLTIEHARTLGFGQRLPPR
jgi:hypothetical protein